jgi:hypothetical protein
MYFLCLGLRAQIRTSNLGEAARARLELRQNWRQYRDECASQFPERCARHAEDRSSLVEVKEIEEIIVDTKTESL